MIPAISDSILTTERLSLRPLQPDDLVAFQSLHADDVVTRYLAPSRPLTNAESFRLFAQVLGHWQLRGFGYWAVSASAVTEKPVAQKTALPKAAPFIGVVGLWFPEGWPGVELGWRFAPDFWGHGFAREAAASLLSFAFDTLELEQVLSIIRADNERSIKLAERLGMSNLGTRTITDIDVVTYGLSRSS